MVPEPPFPHLGNNMCTCCEGGWGGQKRPGAPVKMEPKHKGQVFLGRGAVGRRDRGSALALSSSGNEVCQGN